MNAIVWAVSSAALVVTIGEGALAYRKLPALVPMRFDVRGRAGFRGPRLALLGIFGGIASFIFGSIIVANSASTPEYSPTGPLAAALIFVAFAQHLIIDAILHRGERLAMRPFWIGSAIVILFALAMRGTML